MAKTLKQDHSRRPINALNAAYALKKNATYNHLRHQKTSYIHKADSFDELVIPMENKNWSKFPFSWLTLLEVILQILSMLVVDFFERQKIFHGLGDFDSCLFNFTLEYFRRVKV